MISGIQV